MPRLLLMIVATVAFFAADASAFYSPKQGRFITRDPAGYIDGMNLYEYGKSSPVNFRDPMGLASVGHAVRQYCATKCDRSYGYRLGRTECMTACARGLSDQEKYDLWYEQELNDQAWLANLPDCPCKIDDACNVPDPDVWNKPTTNLHGYHRGATSCMRSKSVDGTANQCCYDAAGELITWGPGQGSADRGAVDYWIDFPRHRREDIVPADLAEELDGGRGIWGPESEKYLDVRPQVGAEKCPKNP